MSQSSASMSVEGKSIRKLIDGLPISDISLSFGTAFTQDELNSIDAAKLKIFEEKFVQEIVFPEDAIRDACDIFAYDGFNPALVHRHVMMVISTLKMSVIDVRRDLISLLALHHMKGNINSNNIKQFDAKTKNLIVQVLTRWKIVQKVGNKKTDIHLPRLGAAFPFQLSLVATHYDRSFSGFCDSDKLPPCMRTSSFPSLVPKSRECTILLLAAYTAHSADQSCKITKKDEFAMKEEDRKRLWNDQHKFTKISYDSTVMDTMHREHAMVYLNLGTSDVYAKLKSCLKYSSYPQEKICTEDVYLTEFRDFQKGFDAVFNKLDKTGPYARLIVEKEEMEERAVEKKDKKKKKKKNQSQQSAEKAEEERKGKEKEKMEKEREEGEGEETDSDEEEERKGSGGEGPV